MGMPRISPRISSWFILFLFISSIYQTHQDNNNFEILSENGKNIKASRNDNNIVIIMQGKYIKYTLDNGLIKKTEEEDFNPTIKSEDNIINFKDGSFILAKSNSLSLYNGVTQEKTFSISTSSSYISISVNQDETFCVIPKVVSNKADLYIFRPGVGGGTIEEKSLDIDVTDNNFVCVIMKNTKDYIVCFYYISKYVYYIVYDSDLNVKEGSKKASAIKLEPDEKYDTIAVKATLIDDKIFLLCALKNLNDKGYYVFCNQGQISEGGIVTKYANSDNNTGKFAVVYPCKNEINEYSFTKVGTNRYACICPNINNNSNFFFSLVETYSSGEDKLMKFIYQREEFQYNGSTLTNPNLIFIHGNYFALAFNLGNTGTLQMVNSPNCKDITKKERYNSQKTNINFSSYVTVSEIDNSDIDKISISKQDPSQGDDITFFCDSASFESECIMNQIWYKTGKKIGTFIFYFSPIDKNSAQVKACKLTFQVEGCNEACKSCSEMSNNPLDTKCVDGCNNVQGYYSIQNNESLCINYQTKEPQYPNYFLDTNNRMFKMCSSECVTCDNSEDFCTKCDYENKGMALEKKKGKCIYKTQIGEGKYITSPTYEIEDCDLECKTCEGSSNNCKSCADLNKVPNSEGKCEEIKCDKFYITESGQKKCCDSCPEEYPFINTSSKECLKECELPFYRLNEECLSNCPSGYDTDSSSNKCIEKDRCLSEEREVRDTVKEIKDNIDRYAKDYCEEYSKTDNRVQVIINPQESYKLIVYKKEVCDALLGENSITLDLGDCSKKIREKNNIPDNKSFITLKMSIPRENKTDQVAYAFYDSETCEVIDLTVCSDEKITVKVPINETEGIDIDKAKEFSKMGVDVFDSEDPFFNDVCFEFTAENGKDVTLKDRRKEYYQNASFCEEGCDYEGVDYETEKAICKCEVKTSFITELLDNELTGDFLELIEAANFEVLACYKQVFNFSYFIKNIGGWILLFLIFTQMGFLIVYIYKGIIPVRFFLLNYMKVSPPINDKDLAGKSYFEDEGTNVLNINNIINESPDFLIQKKQSSKKVNIITLENSLPKPIESSSERQIKIITKQSFDGNGTELNSKKVKEVIEEKDEYNYPEDGNIRKGVKKREIHKNVRKLPKSEEKFNMKGYVDPVEPKEDDDFSDEELNMLEMEDAIIYDHRKFCYFYMELLKEKQEIISVFCNIQVLDPFPIRAIFFFFSTALYFTLNGLFYSEEQISERFYSDGKTDPIYLIKNELSRCIYASMVGLMVNFLVSCLSSSKSRLEMLIKREKDPSVFRKESLEAVSSMRFKNIVFLIFNFCFMFFFWYYISAFCNCYGNTQVMWLIGSCITFFIIQMFPFLLCLIITSSRFLGMRFKIELLYNLSTFLI